MAASEHPARVDPPEEEEVSELDAMLSAGTVEVTRPTWRSGAGLIAALLAGAVLSCAAVVPLVRWFVDSGALVVVFGQLALLVLDLSQHR